MNGWVKLHRSITEWEWFYDPNTLCVFIHCLTKANYCEKNWRGIAIPRGSFVSSIQRFSDELGLSRQQIRTTIQKLTETKELTIKTNNHHTVFTVENYGLYQGDNQPITNQSENSNQPITTTKEIKNKEKEKDLSSSAKNDATPYKKIQEAYNASIGNDFPQMKKISSKRKVTIKKLYALLDKDLDRITRYFEYFRDNASAWHRGENDRGWVADPDYIMRETTLIKAQENTL